MTVQERWKRFGNFAILVAILTFIFSPVYLDHLDKIFPNKEEKKPIHNTVLYSPDSGNTDIALILCKQLNGENSPKDKDGKPCFLDTSPNLLNTNTSGGVSTSPTVAPTAVPSVGTQDLPILKPGDDFSQTDKTGLEIIDNIKYARNKVTTSGGLLLCSLLEIDQTECNFGTIVERGSFRDDGLSYNKIQNFGELVWTKEEAKYCIDPVLLSFYWLRNHYGLTVACRESYEK